MPVSRAEIQRGHDETAFVDMLQYHQQTCRNFFSSFNAGFGDIHYAQDDGCIFEVFEQVEIILNLCSLAYPAFAGGAIYLNAL